MEEVGTAERRFRSLTSGVYTSKVTARNLLCHLKAYNNTLKLAMKFRMGCFKMKAQITRAFQTMVGELTRYYVEKCTLAIVPPSSREL